ncbi:Mannose-6-phosphate isomerase [Vanrija albida]|uniref:Mannose-6-phosphate isomerase n=1 Tax=Vanrija albida TaxID=181172 RepID=A0ABR3QCW4_9TREE
MSPPVFKIAPGIQAYDWGKKGASSLAAQLAVESVPDFEIDEAKSYAELWMGTHTTLPSRVSATALLSDHLRAHPEFIGAKVAARFPDEASVGQLPFLFKVLSIGTALSIQAHPNKALGAKLHAERPNIYKDPNHKPEMAIALTEFRGFLNFLPLPAIVEHLHNVPEFKGLIRHESVEALVAVAGPDDPVTAPQKAALKAVFGDLMSAPEDKYRPAVEALIARYKRGEVAECEKAWAPLAIQLDKDFPGDVGVLCVFLLNVIDLQPGEAVFLGADVPHAYISGDIMECMAQSDNVVRAGLTPKLRDVPTLVEMLTYEAGPADKQVLEAVEFNRDPATKIYDPPIDEFSVLRVHLAKDEVTTHRPIEGPSIGIVTNGEALVSWGFGEELIVTRGDVFFLAAGHEYKWQARKDSEIFRAFVEA